MDLKELNKVNRVREVGMRIPDKSIRPTAAEFKALIDEGWRLWLDESGYVIGYYPPSLWERMTKLD